MRLDSILVLAFGVLFSIGLIAVVWSEYVVRDALRAAKANQTSNLAASTLPVVTGLILLVSLGFIAVIFLALGRPH